MKAMRISIFQEQKMQKLSNETEGPKIYFAKSNARNATFFWVSCAMFASPTRNKILFHNFVVGSQRNSARPKAAFQQRHSFDTARWPSTPETVTTVYRTRDGLRQTADRHGGRRIYSVFKTSEDVLRRSVTTGCLFIYVHHVLN
jgi:hypothetical protein